MATIYPPYIYNHMPDSTGTSQANLFSGTQLSKHEFKDVYTWGFPVYVLDPTLQQGKELLKWQP